MSKPNNPTDGEIIEHALLREAFYKAEDRRSDEASVGRRLDLEPIDFVHISPSGRAITETELKERQVATVSTQEFELKVEEE